MPTPARRVILLGASNVALSFATIVQTVRRMWSEPIEILAAMGHGRSYGQDSWLFGKKFSGIFPCALWQELGARPPLPTTALVTDVGNDLVYGVAPARLLEWVEQCLDRLAAAGAATTITELPVVSLERLGETRFRFFRTMFFPRSAITLPAARTAVQAVNEGLVALGRARKMPVIPVSNAWYGFDPIHFRRGARRTAWPLLLSPWRENTEPVQAPPMSVWERAYLANLAPHERSIFGVKRCQRQPSGRLNDGTTISLY